LQGVHGNPCPRSDDPGPRSVAVRCAIRLF
jgi:hypothetical protein